MSTKFSMGFASITPTSQKAARSTSNPEADVKGPKQFFAKQLFHRSSNTKMAHQPLQSHPPSAKAEATALPDLPQDSNPPQLQPLPPAQPLMNTETAAFDHATQQGTRLSDHSEISRPSTVQTRQSTPENEHYIRAEPLLSHETEPSSAGSIAALQTKPATVDEEDLLLPLEEDDPRNFDLVADFPAVPRHYSLEERTDVILSTEHLKTISDDPTLLQKFTSFISTNRPKSLPVLQYYLDAIKALRAIRYSNAIVESLRPINGLEYTTYPARPTVNQLLETKAAKAFETLVTNDLPAYITYTWIQMVSLTIQMRIVGTLPPHLRERSDGLAETFCLTDPSRQDNPIIFASEEFHRTTQYGVQCAIGRNCRFLQGPKTSRATIQRLSACLKEGRETSEIILNYRRDGSTFLNLLVMAPLLDSRGKVRYFIGSQIDVSGLAKDATDLPGLKRLLEKQKQAREGKNVEEQPQGGFLPLTEMLSKDEVELVRKHGGRMHKNSFEDDDASSFVQQPRLLLKDHSPPIGQDPELFSSDVKVNGRLPGIYQHYLLVRPYPSLRILFVSPSLRIPGMLQSPLMNRIVDSPVRDELQQALAAGRGVTAKVRWISSPGADEGRKRWLHCTPLLGQNGAVGVWMIVLVDDYPNMATGGGSRVDTKRLPRAGPPPVPLPIPKKTSAGILQERAYSPAMRIAQQQSRTHSPTTNNRSPAMDTQRLSAPRSVKSPIPVQATRQAHFDRIISHDEPERESTKTPDSNIRIGESRARKVVGSPVATYDGGKNASLESFEI